MKQVVEISSQGARLSLRNQQLMLDFEDGSQASFPCEDVGMLVIDHPRVSYSHSALTELAVAGAVTVLCGSQHIVDAFVVPVAKHGEVGSRLREQIGLSVVRRKQLWQQVVAAKIRAQAGILSRTSAVGQRLKALARTVQSGDKSNHEALAARLYWGVWLHDADAEDSPCEAIDPAVERFVRDPDLPGVNAALNYGYAIVRAAVIRAIVSAGLQPALGINHSNRSNPFCLADDLMEPLRPLVDKQVRSHLGEFAQPLHRDSKRVLLEILSQELEFEETSGPLMAILHRYVTSFVRCVQDRRAALAFPLARPTSSKGEESSAH
jgi:CRISPR-associated protein Cas1